MAARRRSESEVSWMRVLESEALKSMPGSACIRRRSTERDSAALQLTVRIAEPRLASERV
jgi:hypothetical protein